MTDGPGLDLGRTRDVGLLFRDSGGIYARYLGLLVLIGLAVCAPVQLVVSGIGLEELTSGYRADEPIGRTAVSAVVSFFVITPLITAATIFVLRAIEKGEKPRPGPALQGALDVFTPLFLAVLIATTGILLGLLALILPGIYLAVRWYFVTQVVVIEGKRGLEALTRSAAVSHDAFWRTLGILLLANLAAAAPSILVLTALTAVAESADSQAVLLIGEIATESLTTPFVAVVATLLFYDLRMRKASVAEVD